MTCDEFVRLTNSDPAGCTPSEMAAVVLRAHKCPAC
jgi:hypothetical protein